VTGISCGVPIEILELAVGYVPGKPSVCLATMRAFSRDISLSLHNHRDFLKVLLCLAEEGVELAILRRHDLERKCALGWHEMAPLSTKIQKN
jgi:hypothetical protein